MGWIVLLILVVCFFSFPTLRCAVLHPVALVRYGVKDLIQYIKYERWNECKTGELVAYVGLFGKGKTLSPFTRSLPCIANITAKPSMTRTGASGWSSG